MKRVVIVLASLAGVLLVVYPLSIWAYCLLDDYVLRPDGGKWHFANGTFWHSYKLRSGSDDATYDWQIDLFPPRFNLGYGPRNDRQTAKTPNQAL